jgi:RNA polymerase sigma-70 factor (ECF subfamily)
VNEPASSLTFARVFSDHADYVLGLLRRLGVSERDVQDVAQEVFMVIHAQLPRFEGRSSVKTWVCGIALRRAADYRRKAHRRRESALQPGDLPSSAALAESAIEQRQSLARVEHALAQLPDKQLQVFVLYELEELPMADVAKAVGCPRFTAYTRLRAARRALFAQLAADQGGAPIASLPRWRTR